MSSGLFERAIESKEQEYLKISYDKMTADMKKEALPYVNEQLLPLLEELTELKQYNFLNIYFGAIFWLKSEDLSPAKKKKAAELVADINSKAKNLLRKHEVEISQILTEKLYDAIQTLAKNENYPKEFDGALNLKSQGKVSTRSFEGLKKYHKFFKKNISTKKMDYKIPCINYRNNSFLKESKSGFTVNSVRLLVNGCALLDIPISEDALRKQLK